MDSFRASLCPVAFDVTPRTRLVFGNQAIDRVGELARELGGTRVLLVTDAGIVRAGHAERARTAMESVGLTVALFDQVRENPTTIDVGQCLAAARENRVDLLVGLGGGSAMDTAKGCNFLYTNGGQMKDYWGVGKAMRPMLPLIAIPTTAGTGSECQSAALIADEQTHQKMACLDPKAAARVAVLDPVLTLSQPPGVTAATGIDAIAHAVETMVTTKRNAVSVMYSLQAFRLGMRSLPRVLAQPDDLEARGEMLLAAAFAGLAVENSMLGAAHAAANPLTARHAAIHGQAVGLMLPQVVRFNGQDPRTQAAYVELAAAGGIARVADPPEPGWRALIERLDALLVLAGMPRSLAHWKIDRSTIPGLAAEAARQWTARFNPRPVGEEAFAALYEGCVESPSPPSTPQEQVTAGEAQIGVT